MMHNVNIHTDIDIPIIKNFQELHNLSRDFDMEQIDVCSQTQPVHWSTTFRHICCVFNRNSFTLTHGWADMFLPEMLPLATDLFR